METILLLPFFLAAFISSCLAFVDLLPNFNTKTLLRAWVWVVFILFINILATTLVLWGLDKLKITVNNIKLDNIWIKAVVTGFFLPIILKSIKLKVGKGGNPLNPELRYNQIMNILKDKIAQTGLSASYAEMQKLLTLSLEELRKGALNLTYISELWRNPDDQKEAVKELAKWRKKEPDEEKHLLAQFISDRTRDKDFPNLISVKGRLSFLPVSKLYEIAKKIKHIPQDEQEYIKRVSEAHSKEEVNDKDYKLNLIEFITKHLDSERLFNELND